MADQRLQVDRYENGLNGMELEVMCSTCTRDLEYGIGAMKIIPKTHQQKSGNGGCLPEMRHLRGLSV